MADRRQCENKGQNSSAKGDNADIARLLSISSVMSCHGRHLVFVRTGISVIRSADPENHTGARTVEVRIMKFSPYGNPCKASFIQKF